MMIISSIDVWILGFVDIILYLSDLSDWCMCFLDINDGYKVFHYVLS